jgi:hypothetical protein
MAAIASSVTRASRTTMTMLATVDPLPTGGQPLARTSGDDYPDPRPGTMSPWIPSMR